jgi:1-acyl-sn-glycerol-3-phosphate acyltransferase
MILLRSLLFNIAFYVWTVFSNLAFVWALACPPRWTVLGQRLWAQGVLFLCRAIAGVRMEVRGREHLPNGPVIVAAKHQSAWDTLVWHALLDDPAIVMKKELLSIPIYGGYARKARMIAVDRGAGPSAMRGLIRDGKAAAERNSPIVIFPQGTRVAPVASAPYQPGIAALYKALNIPVVPVALNSGSFWPRRSFLRRPGTIVLEYLPPIAPGLARDAFMTELESRIEGATARLEAKPSSL